MHDTEYTYITELLCLMASQLWFYVFHFTNSEIQLSKTLRYCAHYNLFVTLVTESKLGRTLKTLTSTLIL